jgi:hypothetical protein
MQRQGMPSNKFSDGFLRVSVPQTTNGSIPAQHPRTGQPIYRVYDLPLSAQKDIEKKNLKLPVYLQKKIEVIKPSDFKKKLQAKNVNPGNAGAEEVPDEDFENEFTEEEDDDFSTESEDAETEVEQEEVKAKTKKTKVKK